MNATANTNTTDSSNQGGHLAPNSNAAAKAGESKHASSLSVQASTASDRHSRAHEASNLRGLRTATTSPLAGRGAGSASLPSLTLAQLKEDQERAVSPLAGGTATRSSKLTSASSPGMSPPAKLQSGASSPMGSMGSMGSMSSLSASQSNLSALGGRTASAQASAEAAAAATANGLRFDRNVLHRALAVDSEAREMLDAEMTQREERARQSAKSGEKLQTLILAEEAVKTFSMQFLHRIRMSNPRDRDVMQATMKKYLFTHTITPGTPCTLRVSSKSVVAEAREPARKSHKETNYGGYSTKEASTANDPDAELPLSISLFSVSTTCISDDDSSLFSLSLTDSKDSSRHSCYVFRADSQLPSDPVGDPASSAATGNSASAIPVALAFASAFRMAYARFKLMATKRDSGTGYTALHWAAKKGQLALCAMWLKAGADPNALSRGGYNPLHLATMHGHNEVMRLLVRSGANPHADSYGGFNSHDLMTVRVVEEKVAIVPPSGTLASGRRGKKQRQQHGSRNHESSGRRHAALNLLHFVSVRDARVHQLPERNAWIHQLHERGAPFYRLPTFHYNHRREQR
ncbi:hypothetical protein CAOG_009448 [Capsaspora owczarzaki ATCC 30864]|uniref:Uncharacterized protein n=1 Tax=Capsaspora owczarzaki (strain ATCC 30864) TaxID=595528 RepID=A0A0D2WKU4_CAPO3|nr:hypothetical protein CAOG_009448 [Capsaspora owczarzaki ATCC 30864]